MKALLTILILWFVGCFFSCQKTHTMLPDIIQAEILMEEHPDSSLSLLERIKAPEKLSVEEYAIWCLLVTQARSKMYVPQASDSVIMVSVDYFSRLQRKERLAWSYYYAGLINWDIQKYTQAQSFLLLALDLSEQLKNKRLIGRIYENLGNLYYQQDLNKNVLPIRRKALEAYESADDTLGIVVSLRDIGRFYALIEPFQLDSAEFYYKKSLWFLKQQNLSNRITASVLNDLSNLYKRGGDYAKAIIYLRESICLARQTDGQLGPKYLNLGDLYMQMGINDSARFFLQKCMEYPDTRVGGYSCLSKLEEKEKSWIQALAYKDSFIVCVDSMVRQEQFMALASIEKQYLNDKEIAIIEEKKLKSELLISIFFSVIVLILLIVCYIMNGKKHEKELQLYQSNRILAEHKRILVETTTSKKELENENLKVIRRIEQLIEEKAVNMKSLKELNELCTKSKQKEIQIGLQIIEHNQILQRSSEEKQQLEIENQNILEKLFWLEAENKSINTEIENLSVVKENKEKELLYKTEEVVKLSGQLISLGYLKDNLCDLQNYILEGSAIYRTIKLCRNKTHCNKQSKFPVFDAAEWDIFLEMMNIAYSGFVELLSDKFELKKEYQLLACLIYLDIKPCNVQLIYHISFSAVSNQRRAMAEYLKIAISELDKFIKNVHIE